MCASGSPRHAKPPTATARTCGPTNSEPADRPWLWRYAGLLRAGVRVAVSSDAPYGGEPDPWATMHAAATRRLGDGTVLGPDEIVAPERTLATMLTEPEDPSGPARTVVVGSAADLCLLDRPLAAGLDAARRGRPMIVPATFVRGQLLTAV